MVIAKLSFFFWMKNLKKSVTDDGKNGQSEVLDTLHIDIDNI